MEAKIIDGRSIAQRIKDEVGEEVASLREKCGSPPGLCAFLIGENAASEIYVRMKRRACEEVGIFSETVRHSSSISTEEVLTLIDRANEDEKIDAILVQLPLPEGIDTDAVLSRVRVDKDVDAFHPQNIGRLVLGSHLVAPCTPAGIMEILKAEEVEIKGKEVVVVGRSIIVGRPTAILLIHAHGTVTVCHSRTVNLKEVTRRADILVSAIGKPWYFRGEDIKEGAVVIDVGINRVNKENALPEMLEKGSKYANEIEEKGYTLIGDVHFDSAVKRASKITPVPGGVGPLTIAMLLKNTLTLAKKRRGVD